MFKSSLALLAFVTVAPSAFAHHRVEQVTSYGHAKLTEIAAKWSAEHEAHQECRRIGGSVIFGSTTVLSCLYQGGGYHQCRATCGCKTRF